MLPPPPFGSLLPSALGWALSASVPPKPGSPGGRKMAGRGCKGRREGGGHDLAPWCPGPLAAGRGWRKAALNGVSVETGKANTSAGAVWPAGGEGGEAGWGRGLSCNPPTSPLPVPEGLWLPGPLAHSVQKGSGFRDWGQVHRRPLHPPSLPLPHCPTPNQCPSCLADARKVCAQEGRAGT